MDTLHTTTAIREAAADLIVRQGWHQGSQVSRHEDKPLNQQPLCVTEAVARAAGLPPVNWGYTRCDTHHPNEDGCRRLNLVHDALDEVATELGWTSPNDHGDNGREWLEDWNDQQGRTLDEVLAALQRST
ncbi:DUF6197 family protein [Nonomuraea basaltis]|uniref:DUF6197 family protein n=1 Tax=Nonomuraea basaltis TaxID=2495887 RepID=UPI00110C5BD2|nr:hypothetical protein [Nonomuraea basaltis]TMR91282.1 hypothetical protein EJK15_50720 [Nonomuraea basaltis]